MAFSIVELVETPSTTNGDTYTSGSYAPTADRALIALCYATGTHDAATGSGNGLTWTPEANFAQGANHLYVFSAPTGSTPSSGGFTLDVTGDAATGAGITVLEVDGADLADIVRQVKGAAIAAGGTPAATFNSPTEADCAIVGILGTLANPPAATPPAASGGYTEHTDNGYNNPASGWEVVSHAAPGAVSTVTWGATVATAHSVIIVELNAAAPVDTEADVSWAEMEVPTAPRRADASWAEMEVPNAPRSVDASWAEMEVPNAPRSADVSWAEMEAPAAPRSTDVSWAEMEVPDEPRSTDVSWAEMEVPTAPRSADVSWAEAEIPTAPRRADVGWAEMEAPDSGGVAQVSHAEMELPDAPRAAQVSWAELKLQPGSAKEGWEVSGGDLGVPGSGKNRRRKERPRGLGHHHQAR